MSIVPAFVASAWYGVKPILLQIVLFDALQETLRGLIPALAGKGKKMHLNILGFKLLMAAETG